MQPFGMFVRSYLFCIGPVGQVGCEVIMQPHVHEPPLGPSTTVEGDELLKQDAPGFPPTRPTSVQPPGTT
jgi:hypothetical protein